MRILFPLLIASLALAQDQAPLRLIQTIPLPNVQGRIDHLAADLAGSRLFLAALGNNTVEVIDLAAGRRTRSLPGFEEPQGLVYLPDLNRLYVANGGNGAVQILDGASLQVVNTVKFPDDADNVRYDRAAKRLYAGYGKGALGILDPTTGKRLGDLPLDGHPESFQLESSGPRIFVNVPTAGHVAVIDRNKGAVISKWTVSGAGANFPMALDESSHRLFIACRKPPKVLVFDTTTGKPLADLPCAGDADDLFYDAARRRIYVSGGEGAISVFAQRDPDHYQDIAKIPTAPGARTSLFVPQSGRLYLAVPQRPNQPSALRVYQAQ